MTELRLDADEVIETINESLTALPHRFQKLSGREQVFVEALVASINDKLEDAQPRPEKGSRFVVEYEEE